MERRRDHFRRTGERHSSRTRCNGRSLPTANLYNGRAAIATLRTRNGPQNRGARAARFHGQDTAQLVPENPQDSSTRKRSSSPKGRNQGAGEFRKVTRKLVKPAPRWTQVFGVQSDRAGFMLVSGNYHKYWNATVNGKPAKVYKAFGALHAPWKSPAGKSQVVMRYLFQNVPSNASGLADSQERSSSPE